MARKSRLLQRIGEWFWRGSALHRVRLALPEPGPRATVFAKRAHASAELAKNTLAPAEPSEISVESDACELYRNASYWALCALVAKADPELAPEDSERVWAALDETLLAQATSDERRVEELRRALRAGSFVFFAELPPSEQKQFILELRKLTQLLLAKLAERSVALDAIYQQRAWRLALLALLGLCVAMSPAVVKKVLESRSELSAGKPWRTSSKYQGGCASPAQQCPENTGYFFHTLDDATPWVEFDLGANQKISKVVVDNRSDCCSDRADPLAIEVSTDQKRWRKVAHHEGDFTNWEATFTPTNGRYLRIRLLKQGYLHFAGVHIY
jgi:F5/8 type C domain-containing protein